MTSVNSPACLLARNHFYRSLPPSPQPMKSTFSCQSDSQTVHRQRQITLWVTMATPPGFPVAMGTRGLRVNIVLGSSSSKPTNPADRRVK